MKDPANEPSDTENGDVHLPLFRTWRGIYFFVIGCFIFCVTLLIILTRAFS